MHARALRAKRESKSVDFKRSFEPGAAADWCELIKDIVAMANTGGGAIIIGVANDGTSVDEESADRAMTIDSAVITDKLAAYTGVHFDAFTLELGDRGGHRVAVLSIDAATHPLVFERPGTYAVADNRQKTAFGVGTLYVRHGAKSEPATSADISRILERLLAKVRKDWLQGVRRVVNAPSGSAISVLPPGVQQSDDPNATPIRITTDPNAPEFRLIDPDVTHPLRATELLKTINESVHAEDRLNSFHILALRRLYDVDSNPRFFHKARFGSPQYSLAFASWLLEQYARDQRFFEATKEEYRRRRDAE